MSTAMEMIQRVQAGDDPEQVVQEVCCGEGKGGFLNVTGI